MHRFSHRARVLAALALTLGVAAGCSDSNDPVDLTPFTLNFAAVHDGQTVGCGDVLTGLGTGGTVSVQLNDLRFYVSNLKFYNEQGGEVPVELATNDFQYSDASGSVALIDLTSTTGGACAGSGLSFPEGTARTNAVITGTSLPDEVHSISFDVGIPQALMKHILATHTDADAPSPLAEMHWSWAYAYRHFVMNFTLDDNGTAGEGYIHVGSTGCGGDGTRAMTDRDVCDRVNTPRVRFSHFHLTSTVGVDVDALLGGLDFRVTQSPGGPEVPGVASHSSPAQPHTAPIFANLGIDVTTGAATAANDHVFVVQ
ncbi:MAG TPA: MbnP family copper-binding protein [Gemmatimonadales bacterium]|nr:MbnP family copper-binding protein [Gemmatimonadales bacterium]